MLPFSYGQLIWWENNLNTGIQEFDSVKNGLNSTDDSIQLNYNSAFKIDAFINIDFKETTLNQCEIFTVYVPSYNPKEELIWKFNDGNDQVFLTDKRLADLVNNKFINFLNQDLTQPQIVNYHHSFDNFSTRVFSLNTLPEKTEIPIINFSGYLAELILFNHKLPPLVKQILQSHLSLKYNIGIPNSHFYNQDGKIIWHYNDVYHSRICGIGKSDIYHLNQKQSLSKFGKGYFSIAIGSHYDNNMNNPSILNNNSYLLWGDNDAPIIFENFLDHVKLLKRNWQVKKYNFDRKKCAIKISHHDLLNTTDSNNHVWLALYNSTSGKKEDDLPLFYKMRKKDNEVGLDSFVMLHDTVLLKIFDAPLFWAYIDDGNVNCQKQTGNLFVKPVGGEMPVTIIVNNGKSVERFVINEKSKQINIEVEPGEYSIELIDNSGLKYKTNYFVNDSFFDDTEVLSSIAFAADNPVTFGPIVLGKADVTYRWVSPSGTTTWEDNILIDEEGVYLLELSHEGCSAWYEIVARIPNTEIKSMVVYPNPTVSHYVDVSAVLSESQSYQILISDNNGRIVSKQDYPIAQFVSERIYLKEPGIYTITLRTNDALESQKIIVLNP